MTSGCRRYDLGGAGAVCGEFAALPPPPRHHAVAAAPQCTEDAIPINQSEEIYAGLRRLGKVATLVRYYDEEMGLWTWSQENLEDLWYRSIAWFDRYL